MKRFCAILIAIVILFTSYTFQVQSKVKSHGNPEDPNLAYPIIPAQQDEDAAPQSIPVDSPLYAYPIEGMELPALVVPGEIFEPNEFENPLPESYSSDVPLFEPILLETFPQDSPTPSLKLTVEPSIYIPGKPVFLHWSINNGGSLVENPSTMLSLQFSEGLTPSDETLNNQFVELGRVNLSAGNSLQGSIELIQINEPTENLRISVFLNVNSELLDATFVNIPFLSNNTPTDSLLSDWVRMIGHHAYATSTDDNVTQNLVFASSQISPHLQPGYVLSKNAIEVVAVDKNTATNVSYFSNPITLIIPYSTEELTPEQENDLQVFYYDDNAMDWFPMLTEVDTIAKTLTVQTDHLTVFDYKPANWQSYLPPFQDAFSVAEYTGAATYKMDFPVISGTAGIQPSVSLRYNSQVIDEGTLFNQASWVGMGWSLDLGSITRDMHGTDSDLSDDTFFLSLNGAGGRLLPVSEVNDIITYRLQYTESIIVQRNVSTDSWTVKTPDGTTYFFGSTASERARTVTGINPCGTGFTWQWMLSKSTDRNNNEIAYIYTKPNPGTCSVDRSIVPSQIDYSGVYSIRFVTSSRDDYRDSWNTTASKVLFSNTKLDAIEFYSHNVKVKDSRFSYTNTILPLFIWRDSTARTLTLAGVQEIGYAVDGTSKAMPATSFTYGNSMHITKIKNGIGGEVNLTYKLETMFLEAQLGPRTERWAFNTQCPSGHNLGWIGRYASTYCTTVGNETLLYFPAGPAEHGGYEAFATHVIGENMLKPASRFRFLVEGKGLNNTPTGTVFGFKEPRNVFPECVLGANMTICEGSLDVGVGYPLSGNVYLLNNSGSYIKSLEVVLYPSRHVVSMMTVTDTSSQIYKPVTWEYTYSGFAFNNASNTLLDGCGLNCLYTPLNYEFRGFNTVSKTAQIDGQTITEKSTYDQSISGKGNLLQHEKFVNDQLVEKVIYTYAPSDASKLYSYTELSDTKLKTYADLNIYWNRVNTEIYYSFNPDVNGIYQQTATGTYLYYNGQEFTSFAQENALNKSGYLSNVTKTRHSYHNGSSWITQYYQTLTFKLSSVNDIPWLPSLVTLQSLNDETGVTLSENRYNYDIRGNKLNQKTLAEGSQYSQTSYSYTPNGDLSQTKTWQNFATVGADPTGEALVTDYVMSNVAPGKAGSMIIHRGDGISFVTTTDYLPELALPVKVTQPNGAIEGAAYDPLGRIIYICAPLNWTDPTTPCGPGNNPTASISYNYADTPISITVNRLSTASQVNYLDGFGRELQTQIRGAELDGVAGQTLVQSAFIYDGFGNKVFESIPFSAQETEYVPVGIDVNQRQGKLFTYDLRGRLLNISRRDEIGNMAYEINITYSAIQLPGNMGWGLNTISSNANNQATHSYSNPLGQVVKTIPPAGPSVSYTFDLIGRLTETAYGTSTTAISYNPAGQKIQMADADMGTWSYTYDAQGNLLTQTTATITTTLTYDGLNRVISKSFSDGSPAVSFTYDANGDLGYRTGMTDSTGSTAWDLDGRGRLVTEEKTISGQPFTTNYTYDSADQLTSMTYPSGEIVNITHLPQGGTDSVGSYQTGMQVNENGKVSQKRFGNNTTTSYIYSDWLTDGSRLSQLQSGQSGSLLNLEFAYDLAGNITTINDNLSSSEIQTFTYDSMNRLTSARINASTQTYAYSPSTGNLSYKSDVGAYTYSPAHPHAVTQAGANTYAYDQNGNMASRTVAGVAWTYTYNVENQLTSVRKNSQLVSEYGYDGDGKRVWAKDYEGYLATNPKVTTYIGNYYEVQVEGYVQPTGGTPSQPCNQTYCAYFPYVANIVPENISYYYADGQRIAMKNNGEVSYLYGDQLGSVSAVADSSGALVSKTLYQPWGTTRYTQGTKPTDYAYTGQMQEGDIYFYNSRWYDPQLGRFLQADTIVPPTQGTQGFDRFAYVNNNPLRYTDPNGRWAESILDIAFIAFDLQQIANEGWTLLNSASLVLDVACLVLPIATGGGPGLRLAVAGNDVVLSAAQAGVKVPQGVRAGQLVTKGVQFFSSSQQTSNSSNYPNVIDPRTGKPIPQPPDDLIPVPKEDRVPWTKYERAEFIRQWHERGYTPPTGGWKGYDIHHIIPRELGGTNDFFNLVPVDRIIHQNEFNKWWRLFIPE
ncbi:RHS repeat-associated core domain-containing protein [Candidatus Brevifilum fermentans]|uniref:Teneurin-like YD-shell domain-containing protein n=1 Tax=Candidatus Brevifilum fermentans TaxID=1986204 RepID=A0A1Y6K5V2_9CHLR|nr:RHS repeat-associated core domain-containing protein [Brevefilum fermentans]SMX53979.1 exported protein of unknown function [Brevefilum fermentans]